VTRVLDECEHPRDATDLQLVPNILPTLCLAALRGALSTGRCQLFPSLLLRLE
jgi:hypothetical protein